MESPEYVFAHKTFFFFSFFFFLFPPKTKKKGARRRRKKGQHAALLALLSLLYSVQWNRQTLVKMRNKKVTDHET